LLIFRLFIIFTFFNVLASTVTLHGYWNPSGVTVAGGYGQGSGISQFFDPWDVILDSNNYLYVADYSNCRIQRWAIGGTYGVTVAGNGVCGSGVGQLFSPAGVFVDSSTNVYVSDYGNRRIQRWSNGASVGVTVGTNIDCYGIHVDIYGTIYASDVTNHQILRWSIGGGLNGVVVAGGNGQGSAQNQFYWPWGIHLDVTLSYIYVADAYNHRIQRWTIGGSSGVTVCGGFGLGSGMYQLNTPTGVVIDNFGYLYVADSGNHRIMQWGSGASSGSLLVGSYGTQLWQFNMPYSVRLDSTNNLYVVDRGNARIQQFYSQQSTTTVTTVVTTGMF
jgi:hypothetical protein